MKDAVIILSGGMDSSTLLREYAAEVALAVTFDYGANHGEREIACARRQCADLGVEHLVIQMDFMARHFQSSLLAGAEAIPEGHYADDNMRSTVVPFRNGIMLSIAAGLAESRGLRRVMMANHAGDHAIYPDCRPAFATAMDGAIQAGTYDGVRLVTPYTHLTKGQIAARGAALGMDYRHTWSCYKGLTRHCGRCGTCVERKEALAQAGLPDPTEYEE